jgi:predicted metal-dependent peptidase
MVAITRSIPLDSDKGFIDAYGEEKGATMQAEFQDFWKLLRIRVTEASVGQPYIAPAIFNLVPVYAPGLRTMGVDRWWRVYVDFDYMIERGAVFAAGVLNHEPWHLLRDHEARFKEVDGDTMEKSDMGWNISGDLEINDDIAKIIPEDSLFPETGKFVDFPKNLHAEKYYEILMQHPEILEQFVAPKPECSCDDDDDEDGQNNGGQQDGGDEGDGEGDSEGEGQGDGEGDSEGDGEGSGEGQDGKDGDQDGQGKGKGQKPGKDGKGQGQGNQDGHGHGGGKENCPVHGDKRVIGCGSGSGDPLKDYELGKDQADSLDDEQADSLKREVAENIKQQERSKPGSVPGYASDWAGEFLAAKPIAWQQLIRGPIKAAVAWKRGQLDFNRRRPKRRQPIEGVILPGLQSPKPKLLVGCDSSGSNMGNLGLVLNEVENIARQVGIRGQELRFFTVDVDVDEIRPVNNTKEILNNRRLYGGTRMRPAFELAAAQKGKNRPDVFVLLTDGEVFEDDFPDSLPKGGAGIKFITGIIHHKNDRGWGGDVVSNARKRLEPWGVVVDIEIGE